MDLSGGEDGGYGGVEGVVCYFFPYDLCIPIV